MNNNLNLKDTEIIEQIKNNIIDDLTNIKNNYQKNIILPINLYDLNDHLIEFQNNNIDKNNNITDLITLEYLFFFSYSNNKFEFFKDDNITNFAKLH